jgi:RNA polymerase sigma-70 factor (ECF subfamily)
MAEYNEDEIVAQIRTGDVGAFCKWVDRYKHRAISIAYSCCANYEDAKDISQEAFIKAFKSIKYFKGQSKFYTWFYRILVNICKDHIRRKKRSKMVNFSLKFESKEAAVELEDIFERVASDAFGPEQQLLNKELQEELTKAINSLPEKQNIVFTLKNIHGLTITEIADITKCTIGTIKAHLFKATANLQSKLKKYIQMEEIVGGVR